MSTHPYIPLYVDDYDAATAHLTPEEDGIYGRLLRLCWRTPGCSLPNEPAWIARKIRLSEADFERIARPVISEFFRVLRGRLVQRRLKEEYDSISRKKTARQTAGKKGGAAKALKSHEKASSNATDLLTDTRAFPEPYPEPEEEDANASIVGEPKSKPRARTYPVAFEAVWRIYPHHQDRSSKPDSLAAWKALPEGERDGLATAIARFTPAKVREAHGDKGAPAMERWLKRGLHLNYASAAPILALVQAAFDGPPELREWIVSATDEAFAANYLDPANYRAADRVIVARNRFAAEKITKDCAAVLARARVTVEIAAQSPPSPDRSAA